MGIEGLLKFLDPIILKEHISSFSNQTAVIDIMSWLYKGCYRCAFQLNQQIQTTNYLYFIFQMLDLLSYYKIKPICVFDGKILGKKGQTLEKRRKIKEENKQKGLAYLKIGNQQQARKFLSRCIIIDQKIIAMTMKALFTKNVQFIVSPYQSDTQMAKMIKLGLADFVITEDSDLIVYGVKSIVKLNQDGQCDYVDLNKWKPQDVDSIFLKEFLKMDFIKRTEAAILAGTDYNKSVKGIGIRKAIKLLSIQKTMDKAIENLRKNKNFTEKVPQDYEKIVMDSKLIFLFATTFNHFEQKLQFLNQELLQDYLSEDITEDYIKTLAGQFYDYNSDIREGRLTPRSLQKRQIYPIDIKNVFSLNASALQAKEIDNIERRVQISKMRQARIQQLEQITQNGGKIAQNFDDKKCNRRQKKEKVPQLELTQQQKKILSQERKKQRQKRFSDFKSVLSTMDFSLDGDDNSQDDLSEDSIIFQQELKREPVTNEKQKNIQDEGDGQYDSQSQFSELSFLNPFARPKAQISMKR